jgi:hypothetical protein
MRSSESKVLLTALLQNEPDELIIRDRKSENVVVQIIYSDPVYYILQQ